MWSTDCNLQVLDSCGRAPGGLAAHLSEQSTGKTLAENLVDVSAYPQDQDIVRPLDRPIKADSHLAILYGNLAPDGAVAKISGKEGVRFSGSARVFQSEEEALALSCP